MIEAHSLKGIVEKVDSELPRRVEYKVRQPVKNQPNDFAGLMRQGEVNTSTLFEEVTIQEKRNTKLIGLLFAHPDSSISKTDIVSHLNLFHQRSGEAVDFFCIGYGAYWPMDKYPDQRHVTTVNGVNWLFSDKAFSDVIDELESTTKWIFSGETDLLLVNAHKNNNGDTLLDYETAIVCNLEAMQRDEAFTSVRAFFEGIFKFAKRNSIKDDTWALSDKQGLQVGKSALKEAVLSLLPPILRKSYKQAEHYAVRNIE